MTTCGPLAGVRVIELGGIGPGPHAAMVLADLGADVVRVRRPGGLTMPAENLDLLHRGKRIVDLDVKTEPQTLLELAAKADVLLDCFRPGTCERLGIGPDDCAAVNPRLIFARITGWGQDGPLAPDGGSRHQLPVADRGAVGAGLPRPAADAAAEPGRRLRRRLDARAARHRRRALRAGAIGQGPGDRRRDGRRGQRAGADDVDDEVDRQRCGTSANRSCSTAAPRSIAATRPPTASTWPSARSSRSSSRHCSPGLGLSADEVPGQFEIGSYPQMYEVFTARFAEQDPRRVGADFRRHRRVRHAGADVERGRRPTRI